jgi:arylsulfatase A-like enzyme
MGKCKDSEKVEKPTINHKFKSCKECLFLKFLQKKGMRLMQLKTLLSETLLKYKQLSNEIENYISTNQLNEAELLLTEYRKGVSNSESYTFQAIIEFIKGNLDKAISILKDASKKHPYNYSIHYNLGYILSVNLEIDGSIENYMYAIKYSSTEEEKNNAKKAINELSNSVIEQKKYTPYEVQQKIQQYEKMFRQLDARVYPIDINENSIIRRPFKRTSDKNEYMVNMYKSLNYKDVDINTRMLFKSELVKGSILSESKTIVTETPIVLPISQINEVSSIKISVNGKPYKFHKLPINQFHYIRIEEAGTIDISSSSKIFVGKPIPIRLLKNKPKLVMKIFVDGLSGYFLQKSGLDKLMPNTFRFFKEGLITTNCNATSEWTLPSMASINTGVYSSKHKLLHPQHTSVLKDGNKILSEYLSEAGYYCANISGSWRTTPTLGYYRGNDRMIYQNFLGGFDSKEIIMETIEHLNSFQETTNYISLSLSDLHNVPDEIESHLYSQVNTDIKHRIYTNEKGSTSVQTKYDNSKIVKYEQEIKRVDALLAILYDYILKKYNNDDILICFHSDHGQTFLDNNFNLLGDQRILIPFMMRGYHVPKIKSEELIEAVDILPSILNSCGINAPIGIDGQLPSVLNGEKAREETFTQIIHPGQPYRVRIKKDKYSYYLETKLNVNKDLTINLENYKSYIIDDKSGEDITVSFMDKKEKYDEFVFKQVKDMIRW